jgi:hypothetical protein
VSRIVRVSATEGAPPILLKFKRGHYQIVTRRLAEFSAQMAARDALDKAAAEQEGGARTRSWLIQKIVTDWLASRVPAPVAKARKAKPRA